MEQTLPYQVLQPSVAGKLSPGLYSLPPYMHVRLVGAVVEVVAMVRVYMTSKNEQGTEVD